MFPGFIQTGNPKWFVYPNMMFPGFVQRSFGNIGLTGGIPSTNLVAWFNAGINVTLSGSSVTQWQDTTGVYTLAAGTIKPTYNQNSGLYSNRPYVTFNGSSMYLDGGNIFQIGTNLYLDILIIAQSQISSSTGALVESNFTNPLTPGRYLIRANTTDWYYSYVDTASQKGPLAYTYDQNLHIHMLTVDRNANSCFGTIDNNYHGAGGSGLMPDTSNHPTGDFRIGESNGSNYWNGNILDVLIYMATTGGCMSQQDYGYLRSYFGKLYQF